MKRRHTLGTLAFLALAVACGDNPEVATTPEGETKYVSPNQVYLLTDNSCGNGPAYAYVRYETEQDFKRHVANKWVAVEAVAVAPTDEVYVVAFGTKASARALLTVDTRRTQR